MALRYAILGLLAHNPRTGYEIKMNFEQSIRFLWNADQTQIYRTLGDLEREGLTEHTVELQEKKPNKKVFSLTSKGQEELENWLSNPVHPGYVRNAELLQVFFSGSAPDSAILANLKAIREGIIIGLSGLNALVEHSELFDPRLTPPRQRFFHECTLDLGIRAAELNLLWIDEIIDQIEAGRLPARG